jgi:hypothetical protein
VYKVWEAGPLVQSLILAMIQLSTFFSTPLCKDGNKSSFPKISVSLGISEDEISLEMFLSLCTLLVPTLCHRNPVHKFISYLFNNYFKIKKSRSGGWSPNWVHSARRPFSGLLYLPRVIVRMENLVEWILAGETEVLGENQPQRHFVHHKSRLTRPRLEPEPPRWEASD